MNSSSLKQVTQWIAAAIVALSIAGCKQGQGERCQVNSDCDDGLTCSQSEPKTCGGSNAEQLDANLPTPDGPDVDAPIDAPDDAPIDAPDDAPIDSPIDAPP